MQVRLTSDQLGPNPNFDRRRPVDDDNPVNAVVPAGTLIEHPEAIYLVINEQAEPVDDEAKAAYQRFISRREQTLQKQAASARPPIVEQAAQAVEAVPATAAPVAPQPSAASAPQSATRRAFGTVVPPAASGPQSTTQSQ